MKGFFTDTTLCIGCKACEVACKQWNQLPDDGFSFTGLSRWGTKRTGLAPTLQRSENTPLRRVLPWWGHHPMVSPHFVVSAFTDWP